MPLSSGDKLGPYEIVAPLGAGGMGEVYRARDTRLGRDVALKILPPDVANDPMRRQRFELEARAVAALNHPNIVAIYDVGDGYIVSEHVDGEPLRGGRLGLRSAFPWSLARPKSRINPLPAPSDRAGPRPPPVPSPRRPARCRKRWRYSGDS